MNNFRLSFGAWISAVLVVTAVTNCVSAFQKPANPVQVSAPQKTAIKQVDNINTLSKAEIVTGWELLFDGKSTENWRGYKQETFPAKGWMVDDGCLKVISNGGGGDIITINQYSDFELKLEWKVSENANSGIMYRVTEKHDASWQTGPEYQVLDDVGDKLAPTEPHSAGALYDLYGPSENKVSRPAGEWNQARIVIKNNTLQHWLNGVKVVECSIAGKDWTDRIAGSKFSAYEGFGIQPKGYIALQDHGNEVWYRNIKIRDLSKKLYFSDEVKLFNGKNFDGLTSFLLDDGKMEDVWEIDKDNGILICKGNPAGYIRTKDSFTNYILKLEWRFNPVTKEAGNSGVLLRMIGEDKVWPKSVEAQLQSGNAGDFWCIDNFPMVTVPERTNGRNTKKTHFAENPIGEWNEYEIIVNGGSIVLLVNGEKVNEAWEVLETPGKICFQSEGAEIQFRNIRLMSLDK